MRLIFRSSWSLSTVYIVGVLIAIVTGQSQRGIVPDDSKPSVSAGGSPASTSGTVGSTGVGQRSVNTTSSRTSQVGSPPSRGANAGLGGAGPSQAGGAISQNGGAPSQNGGAPSQSGGAPSQNGGATSQNGGATSQNGGATSQNGGAASQSGGASSQNGGATSQSGGAPSQNDGATSQNGGATSQSGGATSQNGGATSQNGGATSQVSGVPPQNGGVLPQGVFPRRPPAFQQPPPTGVRSSEGNSSSNQTEGLIGRPRPAGPRSDGLGLGGLASPRGEGFDVAGSAQGAKSEAPGVSPDRERPQLSGDSSPSRPLDRRRPPVVDSVVPDSAARSDEAPTGPRNLNALVCLTRDLNTGDTLRRACPFGAPCNIGPLNTQLNETATSLYFCPTDQKTLGTLACRIDGASPATTPLHKCSDDVCNSGPVSIEIQPSVRVEAYYCDNELLAITPAPVALSTFGSADDSALPSGRRPVGQGQPPRSGGLSTSRGQPSQEGDQTLSGSRASAVNPGGQGPSKTGDISAKVSSTETTKP